jgi:hypothetical protein
MTFVVAYPSLAAVPSDSFLSTRIEELQDHFPLLRTRVVDIKTRSPRFELRERSWTTDEILHKEAFEMHADTATEQERILFDEMTRAEAQDLDTDPMWRVAILTSPGSVRAYLVLSANHVITDGMGTLGLTQALLAPSIADLPYEALDKIPVVEGTIPLRPPLRHLIAVAWVELGLPLLPRFLQSLLRPPRPWPADMVRAPPTQCPWDISVLHIPPTLVPMLKSAGVANGVPALHMTLQVSYALAISHILGKTMHPFSAEIAMPSSERKADLGHAHCTGNYISCIEMAFRPDASADFWAATAKLSAHFRSPYGVALARGGMGLLAYVPDPRPDPAMRDTTMPTGWERFFLEKAEGPAPYDWAVTVSNLGRIGLPADAEDLVWTQGASPFGPVFAAQVIGHEAGLRVTTVWREGAAVRRAEVKAVEETFVRILERVSQEDSRGLTFGQLTGGS